jgi:hypothetical protein
MIEPISATEPVVVQGTQNASFDRVPASETSEDTPQDVVEITITDLPSETDSPASTPATYGPTTFGDKFKFDVQNGMLDPSKRFSPLSVRFDSTAVSTYEAREGIAGQMGANTPYAALFALHYQDANPNPSEASTNVDARTTENRRIDQGLDLLNLL